MEDQVSRSGFLDGKSRTSRFAGDERRHHTRYPLDLNLRYTVLEQDKPIETSRGRTVNLSTSGLRFTAARQLAAGQRVELSIAWPLVRADGIPLEFAAFGTIVWSSRGEAALRIQQHEFRTPDGNSKHA